MHRKSDNELSLEQKIIIGLLRSIKLFFVTIFKLVSGGKKLYQNSHKNKVMEFNRQQAEEIGNRWREIEDLINLGGISQIKQALIDADKLIDYVLKKKNISGNTLGERLKNSENLFSREVYNNLWSAHKLRNTLAHDVEQEVFHWQIKQSMKFFKNALNELKVL